MTDALDDAATDPRQTIVELQRKLAERTAELTGSLERQNATAEILRMIASAPGDAKRSLQLIAETSARLFGAPSVSIQLVKDGEWADAYRLGDSAKSIRVAVPLNQIRVGGRNLPGTVVGQNRQIHIPDLDHLDLALADFPGLPVARASGTRTMCGTPLRREGEATGALIVYRDRLLPFTHEELALQQTFADQAVIAIENARLFNETQEALERQTATSEILRVISQSPTDVQPIFDAIVQTAVRLIRCDIAFVLRRDGATFSPAAGAGPDGPLPDLGPTHLPIDPGANFPSRAIVGKKNVHLPDWSIIDLPEHERQMQALIGVNSALFLPLLREAECIGVLALAGKQANIFGESEIALAESFRDQALIAIENVRLFNETQEALERQTATSEVLQVISNSISSATPVFERILESTERLITCDNAVIFLAMPDEQLHLAAFRGPGADAVRGLYPRPLAQTIAPAVIAARRQIVYEDVANHPDVSEGLREAARAIARGTFSAAMTPLMWEGNAIGMLSVSRDPAIKFNEKELSLLRTFADQAVIAIQNARLFEEVQARTRDLQESLEYQTATSDVLKVISRSSFDLQPVLDTLVDTAVKLCGALNGTICLREGDGYRYRASSGIHGDWAKFLDEHPPTPGRSSMTGRVLLSGRPESVPDVLEDPDYVVPLAAMNKTRSVFGVPLLRHDRVEGVLLLARAEPGLFTQRQIELVQTFADQAVIAIENARLLTELRQRTDDLTESLEHLRTAQDRLVQTEKLASLGQLTAGIAHEIKNPLNFVNNFSALSAELIDELGETLAPAPLDHRMRGDVDELTQMLKSNLETVVQHGKRADSIVKNMLLHSREGSGEQRPADINALLDESLNLAYHGARAEKPGFNITLQRDFDPGAGEIELFPQEITRAFLNLISNGFYAASKRKAENGETDFEPVLSAATKNLGNQVEIRIRDNGTGIPAEVKEKIFNPFFTTKPAGEGTGLGLSMCHDIVVKQHGGRIEVDTQPGQFTEFTIVLPRSTNPANNRKS
ncbi:MAG TPA: GAF domain-containing protein [Bradyrhizobium sp.]